MELSLKKGNHTELVSIKDENLLKVLLTNTFSSLKTEEELLLDALNNPIGTERLRNIVKSGEKIAIITSDITRPMPSNRVLPLLLEELYAAGIKDEDIIIVFALGSHRSHTKEEMMTLVGEDIWNRIKCIDSNPDDCINLGFTKKGTPVDIDRNVVNANRRICLGNIEYHYFAGYSGGAKAIMPGVSTRKAIQENHCMMIDERACVGNINDNPVRLDIEEAASVLGIDFILNVVLDEKKKIIGAFAGDSISAHRKGCEFLDKIYKIEIQEKADIVLVSQGGYPKDLNLYQTQKALDNAKHAVKDGGTIILIGSCKEGLGEKTFEEWILSAKESKSLIDRIKTDFKLGGHKAAAIALVLEKADIYLVSDLDENLVKNIFMKPYKTVKNAYENALKKHGNDAKVIVMPYGGSTLPQLETK